MERHKEAVSLQLPPASDDDTQQFSVVVGIRDVDKYGMRSLHGCSASGDHGLTGYSAKETIHARYLVACDGAHSWVRRQLNVPTDSISEDSTWGVLDIVPITDFRSSNLPLPRTLY